jgi:tetratricopeptide (TPR) repeat protein
MLQIQHILQLFEFSLQLLRILGYLLLLVSPIVLILALLIYFLSNYLNYQNHLVVSLGLQGFLIPLIIFMFCLWRKGLWNKLGKELELLLIHLKQIMNNSSQKNVVKVRYEQIANLTINFYTVIISFTCLGFVALVFEGALNTGISYQVSELVAAGKYDQAIKKAQSLTNESRKAGALEEIARGLVDSGKRNQAWELAQSIKNYNAKAGVLAVLGQFEQALELVQFIKDEPHKAGTLGLIASELAKKGQFKKALEVAQSIEEIYDYKEIALEAIASELAAAGQFDQALEIAKTLQNFYIKAKTLDAIASKLAAAGQYNRALQVAETIQSYYGGKDKMMEAIARSRKSHK